ncbi:MAG: ribonucleoside-diphosphate reductase subunit alpha [Endomicrobia bacterium]|nr:ribonucleoside-diphosphate reductase subunit alpha [Endomicrobiia bacterium]
MKVEEILSQCIVDLKVDVKFDNVPSDLRIDEKLLYLAEQCERKIVLHPDYQYLSGRLRCKSLNLKIETLENIKNFSDFVERAYQEGILNEELYLFVVRNKKEIDSIINYDFDYNFQHLGIKILEDRYLIKNREGKVIEKPQFLWLRVSLALALAKRQIKSNNVRIETSDEDIIHDAKKTYNMIANFYFLPSTPTLFNAGTKRQQLSSCYLFHPPDDSIEKESNDIFSTIHKIAILSKYAGGIGIPFTSVRSKGSLIRGTNGLSNGIVPFLKVLDSTVFAVNQGGKRKGACAVYLEVWHKDIEDFIELRSPDGDHHYRTYNLNLAYWIPDEFIKRVIENKEWTLFSPSDTPKLKNLYSKEWTSQYIQYEQSIPNERKKVINARELFSKMIHYAYLTGNGWFCFKDLANETSNQTGFSDYMIHSSNLCTEILEVTKEDEIAVCNLGSINLEKFVKYENNQAYFDFDLLAKFVRHAVELLDRVIDINFYPLDEAKNSNKKWRPIGLGVMGFANMLYKMQMQIETLEVCKLVAKIHNEIYYNALSKSLELAKRFGACENFNLTKTSKGILHFDLYLEKLKNLSESKFASEMYDYVSKLTSEERWNQLRKEICQHGIRNSLLIAIAPTATIANIAGTTESTQFPVGILELKKGLSGVIYKYNKYIFNIIYDNLKKLNIKEQDLIKIINLIITENSSSLQSFKVSMSLQEKLSELSIQPAELVSIIENIKNKVKTAYDKDMMLHKIREEMIRAIFVDQSISFNLFFDKNTDLNEMAKTYLLIAKTNMIKTTYYPIIEPITKENEKRCTAEICEVCQ